MLNEVENHISHITQSFPHFDWVCHRTFKAFFRMERMGRIMNMSFGHTHTHHPETTNEGCPSKSSHTIVDIASLCESIHTVRPNSCANFFLSFLFKAYFMHKNINKIHFISEYSSVWLIAFDIYAVCAYNSCRFDSDDFCQ